ncbi:MAG: rhomboid family intramembrane serine protease [Firmicutes bacterium]|nr:rhomboid family intramembrane serine protease [Bacillota bacterium]
MIPLRDCIRSKTFPYVNIAIIVITAAIWIWQATMSSRELAQVASVYGVVPARVYHNLFVSHDYIAALLPLTTSVFLHGGWVHVLGNLLYLWVFGDNVEDRLGHFKYLLFYLAAGIAGGLAQILTDPASLVPVVGASGAIAGVLGAYVVSFPRARIETLLILIIFISVVRIPAIYFIVFWFLLQLFNGVASLGGGIGQVAYWAHIGGFVSGMLLIKLLSSRPAGPDETGCAS